MDNVKKITIFENLELTQNSIKIEVFIKLLKAIIIIIINCIHIQIVIVKKLIVPQQKIKCT